MSPIVVIEDGAPVPSKSGLDLYQWNSPNGLRVSILIEGRQDFHLNWLHRFLVYGRYVLTCTFAELLAAGCDVQVTTHDMPLKLGLHTQPWFLKVETLIRQHQTLTEVSPLAPSDQSEWSAPSTGRQVPGQPLRLRIRLDPALPREGVRHSLQFSL